MLEVLSSRGLDSAAVPDIPLSLVVALTLLQNGNRSTHQYSGQLGFLRYLPEPMHPLFAIPLWKRLLAGIVYGGITEELLMRLFLLSLVAWLLGRWWKTTQGMPTPGAFWAAILVVAVLFGLGHLPATAVLTPLTPLLIVPAPVLNGIAGVAFGYLYWKYGLEAAMTGHMSAHVVMQVPGVMLLQKLLGRLLLEIS